MKIIIKEGFEFSFNHDACKSCTGNCCRGESGRILVDQQEIFQTSNLLQINPIDFIQKYLYRIENRFSIKERFTEDGFECIFFNGSHKKCSIFPVRPFQCRKYPFWEHFRRDMEQAKRECPGIIVKTAGQHTGNDI